MNSNRGDVVRSLDPFKIGRERQRPWVIVNNETHPFDDEQYLAVAVSTKEYGESLALTDGVWETGGVPGSRSSRRGQSTRRESRTSWLGRDD